MRQHFLILLATAALGPGLLLRDQGDPAPAPNTSWFPSGKVDPNQGIKTHEGGNHTKNDQLHDNSGPSNDDLVKNNTKASASDTVDSFKGGPNAPKEAAPAPAPK